MRRKWFGIVTAHSEVLRMGPARLRHCLHDFSTQSSHSVDLTGWQAKMASIGIWVLWHNAHKPHFKESLWCTADMRHPATVYEAERSTQRLLKWPSLQCDLKRKELYPSPPPSRKKSNGACAHYVMVKTGIQNSVAAILAFHPALSTEWLDWVAISCELWHLHRPRAHYLHFTGPNYESESTNSKLRHDPLQSQARIALLNLRIILCGSVCPLHPLKARQNFCFMPHLIDNRRVKTPDQCIKPVHCT